MTRDENVIPLERIRRYKAEINKRNMAFKLNRLANFLLEASTICAILGRGLQFISRELGYDQGRRIRFPMD